MNQHIRPDVMHPLVQALAELSGKHKTVVAVMGSAHVPGVRYRFAEATLKHQISFEGMEQRRLQLQQEKRNFKVSVC